MMRWWRIRIVSRPSKGCEDGRWMNFGGIGCVSAWCSIGDDNRGSAHV